MGLALSLLAAIALWLIALLWSVIRERIAQAFRSTDEERP